MGFGSHKRTLKNFRARKDTQASAVSKHFGVKENIGIIMHNTV